jgi:PPP family 3-phenylpropionic acid transporter
MARGRADVIMPELMSSAARLAVFWFLFLGGMGVIFPYQSLYFSENAALLGTELGLVLAVRPLVGMLAQPFWGQMADRTGSRNRVLIVLSAGTAFGYLLLPEAKTFPWVIAAMAFGSIFSSAALPMGTSVSMAALGARAAEHFGRIRVWGTVGFALLVIGFPPVLDRAQAARGLVRQPGGPSEPGLELIFYVAAGLSLAAACVAWRLPREGSSAARSRRGDVRLLLRHRPYRRLLCFSFLAQLCLQAPIQLFAPFIVAHGGSIDTVSRMWIPMLLLEIPLIFYSGATLGRVGVRGLLAIGVIADGSRWLICSLVSDLSVIYALQLLHGVVIAGLFVGSALYAESAVPERLRSTGQGLLAMIGFGAAGVLSNACGGLLLQHFGADAPYRVGGIGALLLGAALPLILPRPRRPEEPATSAAPTASPSSGSRGCSAG